MFCKLHINYKYTMKQNTALDLVFENYEKMFSRNSPARHLSELRVYSLTGADFTVYNKYL